MACTSAPPSPVRLPQAPLFTQTRQQSALQSRFVQQKDLEPALLKAVQSTAQNYSDRVSERRQLDMFQLHDQVLGLRLTADNHSASVISFLGTATTRSDLNVEVRALVGDRVGLNLNYSGPVTRGESTSADSTEASLLTANASALHFELITGLPGEAVTRAYGEHLTSLQQYLRYRFQSRPVTFDDGPLIYAVQTPEQDLLGFVFINSRNLLVLGERKYADVQSVAVIDPRGNLQGAYTLVAFNPKSSGPKKALNYTLETPDRALGQLAILGDF